MRCFILQWTYIGWSFSIDDEIPILQSFGMKIDVFDYAEDWCLHQEPDIMTLFSALKGGIILRSPERKTIHNTT